MVRERHSRRPDGTGRARACAAVWPGPPAPRAAAAEPAPGARLPGSLEDGHNRLSERKWAMSAVSPESRRASANLPGSARDQQANGAAGPPGQTEGDGQDEAVPAAAADFGPNEALVDELYQRYLNDPASVDRAWWNFFADYRPTSGGARQEQAAVEKPPAGPGTANPAAGRGHRAGHRGGPGRPARAVAAPAAAIPPRHRRSRPPRPRQRASRRRAARHPPGWHPPPRLPAARHPRAGTRQPGSRRAGAR